MKSTVFFRTNNNIYMYNSKLQSFTIVSPLILYYYRLDKQNQLHSDLSLINLNELPQDFNKLDYIYYFNKYWHYKKIGYFEEEEKKTCLKFSSHEIKTSFYNTEHIVFEVYQHLYAIFLSHFFRVSLQQNYNTTML